MSGSDVELVLDTSAVLTYAAGSIHVGETLAELSDNDALFALPALCLIEASRLAPTGDRDGVGLLAQHPRCVALPMPAGDWPHLGGLARLLGRADLASVVLAASDHAAAVLTAEAASYRPTLGPGGSERLTIIEIQPFS